MAEVGLNYKGYWNQCEQKAPGFVSFLGSLSSTDIDIEAERNRGLSPVQTLNFGESTRLWREASLWMIDV